MTLNAAIVSGRDSINGQPMVDPIGQQSPLPIDVARIIFQNLKADLPAVALVCKNWNALADNEIFRQMIRPAQAFGTKEWQEHIGVDAGKEPRLRRCAYGDLEREGGMLTFIPDKVKVTKENGLTEEVCLDSLEAIGNLINKIPKIDIKTGKGINAWKEAILEKPHWIWIKKEVVGKGETFRDQQKLAKAIGANISGLRDTVISLFMEYFRSGEHNFDKGNSVRVNDEVHRGWRLMVGMVGFNCSGLFAYYIHDDNNMTDTGFAPSRKSY